MSKTKRPRRNCINPQPQLSEDVPRSYPPEGNFLLKPCACIEKPYPERAPESIKKENCADNKRRGTPKRRTGSMIYVNLPKWIVKEVIAMAKERKLEKERMKLNIENILTKAQNRGKFRRRGRYYRYRPNYGNNLKTEPGKLKIKINRQNHITPKEEESSNNSQRNND